MIVLVFVLNTEYVAVMNIMKVNIYGIRENETENLSDKAKFYYDNRNELINILREYMIYSEKF